MGKTYIDAVKYTIYAHFEVDGLVDRPDVVGAIFGQTEGLLGSELDLRNLQKNGRIGRIEVEITHSKNRSYGSIKIPSSLDMVETAVIAAALETVERVGPCEARITVDTIEDNRKEKRKRIIEKAKQFLKQLLAEEIPESREITELVRVELKGEQVIEYGKDKIPAGPGVEHNDEIILVEGRADVINLLRNDITNVVAIGGAKINETVIDLTKRKEVTVFLDGDRGGDIILRELLTAGADIDYVARAMPNKEVEELTRKEIIKCLRGRVPLDQYLEEHPQFKMFLKQDEKKKREENKEGKGSVNTEESKRASESIEVDVFTVKKVLKELRGKLVARIYADDGVSEVSVKDMIMEITKKRKIEAVVFDGIVTQRLVDLLAQKGAKLIAGVKLGNVKRMPPNLEVVLGE